jgi:hypothetical protein
MISNDERKFLIEEAKLGCDDTEEYLNKLSDHDLLQIAGWNKTWKNCLEQEWERSRLKYIYQNGQNGQYTTIKAGDMLLMERDVLTFVYEFDNIEDLPRVTFSDVFADWLERYEVVL